MGRFIDTAERQGLDPAGGKWVVICTAHFTVANVATRAEARACETYEFCEECSP